MSETPPTGPEGYLVAFLTDEWEWEVAFTAETLQKAKTVARTALEDLVRDEQPKLACVTLLRDGVEIGVWDWVEQQAHWTPL